MRELSLESFGFAPMKSSRHLPQPGAQLSAAGPVGDRRFCLVDTDQQKVLRTIGHLELMQVVCTYAGKNLRVEIPGYSPIEVAPSYSGQLTCDYWGRNTLLKLLETPANRAFSDFLGKPVTLAEAEANEVVYGGAYTLIGTASLEELGRQLDYPQLLAEHARLRSTFLVSTEVPFEEESWGGQSVKLRGLGLDGTTLRIGQAIGRCAVIDANPYTGQRDLPLFKLLTASRPRNERGEPVLAVEADLLSS